MSRMSRRRRVEFYVAVAFTAASVSYLAEHERDPLAYATGQTLMDVPPARIVFFLDDAFDHYGPTYGGVVRRCVNVVTAGLWGIALGFLVSLALIDDRDHWRRPGRSDPPPDDPDGP